jgi:2'-5' RNA ligase
MPARCFLAIDLEPPAVALLSNARDALLEAAPDWAGEKWVRPELLHVTLVFIGALQHTQVPDAMADVQRVCAGHTAHELALARVRAKPSSGRASMLWARRSRGRSPTPSSTHSPCAGTSAPSCRT